MIPKLETVPVWWPNLINNVIGSVCLGLKGEKGVVKVPSRRGFIVDTVGLRWPLYAFRVSYDNCVG